MKRFILLLLCLSLALTASCGDKITSHKQYAEAALEIADAFLDGKQTAADAFNACSELIELADGLDDAEKTEGEHAQMEKCVLFLKSYFGDLKLDSSDSEARGKILSYRNQLAVLLGEKER